MHVGFTINVIQTAKYWKYMHIWNCTCFVWETIDVILTAEHKNYMHIKKRTVNATCSSWTRKNTFGVIHCTYHTCSLFPSADIFTLRHHMFWPVTKHHLHSLSSRALHHRGSVTISIFDVYHFDFYYYNIRSVFNSAITFRTRCQRIQVTIEKSSC